MGLFIWVVEKSDSAANLDKIIEILTDEPTKYHFLKTFLKLPNGILSHDTINGVFSSIQPRLFGEAFNKRVKSLKNENITKFYWYDKFLTLLTN